MKSQKYNMWILLFIAAILSSFPIYFIKAYDENKNLIWIILSLLCYTCLVYVYENLFKNRDTSTIYSLAKIVSIIIVVIIGFLIYKEKISTSEFAGFASALLSIYLLSPKL
jgi:multidrug transporter EmrE-like cation transporter